MLMILRESLKKRQRVGHDKIIVTYDQARFTLDADVRRCWAFKGTTPIVYKNGSKESISIGGAYSSTNKFHFYQMDWQVKENVLENIRLIHKEFPNFFLSLIKQHGIRINSLKVIFKRTTFHICFFPRELQISIQQKNVGIKRELKLQQTNRITPKNNS